MEKSGIYDAITMRSNRFPVLDPFKDICPPLKEVVLPMERLSLASSFPEELDFFRNITYVRHNVCKRSRRTKMGR